MQKHKDWQHSGNLRSRQVKSSPDSHFDTPATGGKSWRPSDRQMSRRWTAAAGAREKQPACRTPYSINIGQFAQGQIVRRAFIKAACSQWPLRPAPIRRPYDLAEGAASAPDGFSVGSTFSAASVKFTVGSKIAEKGPAHIRLRTNSRAIPNSTAGAFVLTSHSSLSEGQPLATLNSPTHSVTKA